MRRFRKPADVRGLGLYSKCGFSIDRYEDDQAYISRDFSIYSNNQLRGHLEKLLKRGATPEEFQDPFLEFRERLRQGKIGGRGKFYSIRKYLERYNEYVL